MGYMYQNSYFEQESAQENFSYSSMGGSMGHMANSGCHNSQLGFGNGMGQHQMVAYSSHAVPSSGYGMSHGHSHNSYSHHGGLGLGSSYSMNEGSSFYSAQNSYCPPKWCF